MFLVGVTALLVFIAQFGQGLTDPFTRGTRELKKAQDELAKLMAELSDTIRVQ